MRLQVLLLACLLAAVPLATNASASTVAAVDHCGSGYYAQVGSLTTACALFGGPVRPVPCGSSGTRVEVLSATTTCYPVTPIIVSTCTTGIQVQIGSVSTTCIPGAVGGPTLVPCPGGYYIDWPPLFTTTCLPITTPIVITPCPGGFQISWGPITSTCLPGLIGGPSVYPCPGGFYIDWPPLFTTTCLPGTTGPTIVSCPGGYSIDWPPFFTTGCLPPAITITPCPGGYIITIGTLTTTCLP